MRSPRVVYGVVAGVLVVAGIVLPRYLAERSSPELGETVVVPVSSTSQPPTPVPTPRVTPTPTAGKPTVGTTTGAEPVSPGPARSAGDDDDDDLVDDPDDDDG